MVCDHRLTAVENIVVLSAHQREGGITHVTKNLHLPRSGNRQNPT